MRTLSIIFLISFTLVGCMTSDYYQSIPDASFRSCLQLCEREVVVEYKHCKCIIPNYGVSK